MSPELSAQRISELIGMIYDCALDPARWEETVGELRAELGFQNCVLSIASLETPQLQLVVPSGVRPEWLAKISDYGSDVIEQWGGLQRMQEFPLGEPVVGTEVVGRDAYNRNRFTREWGHPQGVCDSVAITLARQHDLTVHIAWGISSASEGISEQQRSMLRLFAPHLRRAVSIAKLLEMRGLVAETLEGALDGVTLPILLVGERLDLVHANAAAQAMLRNSDPIRLQGEHVVLSHQQTTAALADAVRRAAESGIALGQRGLGLPARRRDGSPAVLHVMPLRNRVRAANLGRRAVAAVFVASTQSPPQMPGAALALLYDLTPAETRVLELLVEGGTREEIGARLGITLATTKTHLQRVFDKTGMTRQIDLVRLVGSLTLPV